ncbi:hypothetical protein, partial [Mycobacterium asiaticum]|uniref:hypothetical protein n=1 Tax=Mycobacterium asiaticum TaxID=1790 RepID=UPI000A5C13C9
LKQHLKTLTGIHLHDPSRSARRHNPNLAATTDKSGPLMRGEYAETVNSQGGQANSPSSVAVLFWP